MLCVPSFIPSGTTKRNFNISPSPGVKSGTETAETLSRRPHAQSRVWTGPWWEACSYPGLRSICGGWPFQTRATKAPGASAIQPFFSPQPPPLNSFLSVLWGQGCFPCICVCFLVFALSCFHLSLCPSLCKFYLALKRVAESVSASSTLYGMNSHPAGVHRK